MKGERFTEGEGRPFSHAETLHRERGVPVLYAPFSRVPLFSELVSLLAPVVQLLSLHRSADNSVIFYNRLAAYLPVLMVSHALGNRNFLDLEDGETAAYTNGIYRWLANASKKIFDRICNGGAILACTALRDFTSIKPTLCYYGTTPDMAITPRFQSDTVCALMGGTLNRETGAYLLTQAITGLRHSGESWAAKLVIHVTGTGPSLTDFEKIAASPGYPTVVVHGRTTNAEYASILQECDVGLSLKLNKGTLADTTFPSKVVEFAGAGMLVLTTDISDVRLVLGEGALYLQRDHVADLEALLKEVVQDRAAAMAKAHRGYKNVRTLCTPSLAGQRVANFVAEVL